MTGTVPAGFDGLSALGAHLCEGLLAARTEERIDELVREVWRSVGAGRLPDGEAQRLVEEAEERRGHHRHAAAPLGRIAMGAVRVEAAYQSPDVRREAHAAVAVTAAPTRTRRAATPSTLPPGRAAPRSPDRAASRARRRTWGGNGRLPPALRALYTEGERAALSVIADWIMRHGESDLAINAIAVRAGVCRTTVQNALRKARRMAHVHIRYRRRPGIRSLTNVIRITSRAWRAWLEFTVRKAGGAPAGSGAVGALAAKRGSGFKTNSGASAAMKKIYKGRRKRGAKAPGAPPGPGGGGR